MAGGADFREIDARNPDKTSRQEMRRALEIYSASFPPVETKPVGRVERMLKTDPDYHLYVARMNGMVVGVSLLYVFRRLGIGLLDYLAVEPSHRREGVGTRLFNHSLGEFRKKTPSPLGLLIEVQREGAATDGREARIREQRIGFYARLGAKILDPVRYLLPPQRGTQPEEMYLMMVPTRKVSRMSKRSVLRCVSAIYARVYDYRFPDLLAAVSKEMPQTITLSEITAKQEEENPTRDA